MTLRLKPPLDGTSLQNGHADANGDGDGVTGNEDGSVTLELDGDDMHEALQ
jgi:hypothetical protein